MAKKKDVVPVFVDNVEALEAKMQAMRGKQSCCMINQMDMRMRWIEEMHFGIQPISKERQLQQAPIIFWQ